MGDSRQNTAREKARNQHNQQHITEVVNVVVCRIRNARSMFKSSSKYPKNNTKCLIDRSQTDSRSRRLPTVFARDL